MARRKSRKASTAGTISFICYKTVKLKDGTTQMWSVHREGGVIVINTNKGRHSLPPSRTASDRDQVLDSEISAYLDAGERFLLRS